MTLTLPVFDAPDLVARIEALEPSQIDTLPYGVIRIDPEGVVRHYSKREAELSGYAGREAIGVDFFARIAPCMDSAAVRGRIEKALAERSLDIRISHVGDFEDRNRPLELRAVSAREGGFWLFLRRA